MFFLPFESGGDEEFFAALPSRPAVCLVELNDANAEPLLIRTQDLRRRLQRLLGPPDSASKRLNLRGAGARGAVPGGRFHVRTDAYLLSERQKIVSAALSRFVAAAAACGVESEPAECVSAVLCDAAYFGGRRWRAVGRNVLWAVSFATRGAGVCESRARFF